MADRTEPWLAEGLQGWLPLENLAKPSSHAQVERANRCYDMPSTVHCNDALDERSEDTLALASASGIKRIDYQPSGLDTIPSFKHI